MIYGLDYTSILSSKADEVNLSQSAIEVKTLLRHASSALEKWSILLTEYTKNALNCIRQYGKLENHLFESKFNFSFLLKTLLNFHFTLIEAIGYGCFREVDIR